MMTREMSTNETIIWSRKGILGNRYFIVAENGMERIVPQKAALEVVRFDWGGGLTDHQSCAYSYHPALYRRYGRSHGRGEACDTGEGEVLS